MKILLTIHHHLDPHSGAPGTVLKLGQAYEKLGHQVDYYAFDHLPQRVQAISPEVGFPEFLAAYLLKQAHRYDVVDASTGDAWLWGTTFNWFHRQRPLLVTRSHGLEHMVHLRYLEEVRQRKEHLSWKYPLYRGSFRLWEVAQSLRCADLAFLLNQSDQKYAVEVLGVPPDRTAVTHNGIPDHFLNRPLDLNCPSESRSETRSEAPRSETTSGTLGIAQIGTYITRKGVQYSGPALNHILQRYPQVKLSLLGTGCPPERVWQDFAPDVRDRIQVIPRFDHDQLPALLKHQQIKLFTPLAEGFGKALVEAMACGLAPVTTAAPGPLEVVQDGHDALVVPLRDSRAIEQALTRLICDRAYLNRLQKNAHQTAQAYGWTQIAQQRINLYQAALAQRV